MVGSYCRIGANAVVIKSVPANSVVVGVPGQIIVRSRKEHKELEDTSQMPDAIGLTLAAALKRLEKIEAILEVFPEGKIQDAGAPKKGIWKGEDFLFKEGMDNGRKWTMNDGQWT